MSIDVDDDGAPVLAGQLRDLLQHPGWVWLCQQAQQEFGPAGYGFRVAAAISEIPNGPDRPYELARVTEQIHMQCEAVNAFVKRPKDQLDKLTTKKSTRLFDHLRRTPEMHR